MSVLLYGSIKFPKFDQRVTDVHIFFQYFEYDDFLNHGRSYHLGNGSQWVLLTGFAPVKHVHNDLCMW